MRHYRESLFAMTMKTTASPASPSDGPRMATLDQHRQHRQHRIQPVAGARSAGQGGRLAHAAMAALAAFTLVACASLPTPAPAPALFDFGALQPVSQAPSPAVRAQPLQLAKVTANGLPTNSQPVLYRFAYVDNNELRAYQQARWSRPVEQLVAQQLRRQLELSRPVLEDDGAAVRVREDHQAPYVLQVDVEQFEQRFQSEQQSVGVVRMRATLIAPGPRGDRLVGQQTFEQSVAAPSPDAAGGTQALGAATQAIAAQIDGWVARLQAQ